MGEAPIVLASASPRRRDLLAAAGLEFEVRPAGADETLGEWSDELDAARQLARRKGRAVAGTLAGRARWVLAADTVVALPAPPGALRPAELLGKPADEREAAAMLGRLSGTRHAVVTAVCVIDCESGRERVEGERTWVTMRALAEREIADYVVSGEWRDKAGGYAIQESADAFVVSLEGRFDNVVGLPVPLALELLRGLGAPLPRAGV